MARPREFDPDTVLDQATRVFWAKGYHNTSVDDLCEAMVLNRSSLYSSFGDKRALFLVVIDRYGEREVASILDALSRPVSFGNAIAHLFADLVEQIATGSGRLGCLTGNTAAAVATHDREVAARVRRNLDRLEGAFLGALTQAKARAEISQHADIAAAARFFVAAIQGLRLIGKTTSDKKVLQDIAQQILLRLEHDRRVD